MSEVFISIDVEADGPIPGVNSMLSFGAAAFRIPEKGKFTWEARKPIATFEANLDQLPGGTPSQATMAWWAKQPEAWAACRLNTRPASEVMPEFVRWVRGLPDKPVVVGFPVTYDFMFLYWYTMAFGGLEDGQPCPYGFQGLDLKTMAWCRLGGRYKDASKKNFPKHWFQGSPAHNHQALTDAIGQGVMFVNMYDDIFHDF